MVPKQTKNILLVSKKIRENHQCFVIDIFFCENESVYVLREPRATYIVFLFKIPLFVEKISIV